MNPKSYKYLPYIVSGIYFSMLDVITEVYGYREGRKALLSGLLVYSIFVLIMETVAQIPTPANYQAAWSSINNGDVYKFLFNNLHLVWVSVVICTLSAGSLNSLALAKWKTLMQGKHFWLRSVTTSLVAAFIYSLLSNIFAFGVFLNSSQVPLFVKLTTVSLSAKLITLLIFSIPSLLLCEFLKRSEGIDVYDYDLSFNIFNIKTTHFADDQQ